MTGASPGPGRAAERSRTWPDDTTVYPGADAIFGSPRWDLSALRTAVNTVPSVHLLDFSVDLPGPWSLLARELCMCRIDLRAARKAGVVLKRPVRPLTTRSRLSQLRRVAAFAAQTGRGLPSSWAQPDLDALLRWHAERSRSHRDLSKTVELVADLHRFGALLTAGGLAFEPWPGLAREQVLTHVLGDGAPVAPEATLTPVMPLEAFVPLLLAARAYVEVFATDILALHRRLRADPSALDPRPAVEVLRAWADGPDARVPVHTERSAAAAPNRTRPGEPIWSVVARLTGTHPKAARACPEIVRELVDAGRTYQGLGPLTAMVEHPDGSIGPWRGPFETHFDVNGERPRCGPPPTSHWSA